jgi:hypothetical protein
MVMYNVYNTFASPSNGVAPGPSPISRRSFLIAFAYVCEVVPVVLVADAPVNAVVLVDVNAGGDAQSAS